jgi:hypothetical protein
MTPWQEDSIVFTTIFSPSTYRISIWSSQTIRVFDIRNSRCLLQESEESGEFTSTHFSPDGTLFAVAIVNGIRIWKYTSDSYTPYQTLLPPYRNTPHHSSLLSYVKIDFRFSPSSSSILSWYNDLLQVWHLDDLPTTPEIRFQPIAISQLGNHIATAPKSGSESTVTILDRDSRTPPRFIDTGMEIAALAITGNVLLVVGSNEIVAWLVMEDGPVDSGIYNKRSSRGDSLWTMPSPCNPSLLDFKVEGQIAVIGNDDTLSFTYDTETGSALDLHEPHNFSRPSIPLSKLFGPLGYRKLRYLIPSQYKIRHSRNWTIPLRQYSAFEWVLDSKRRRRFWVPVEWRESWDREHWHEDITTLFSSIGLYKQPVIIKF